MSFYASRLAEQVGLPADASEHQVLVRLRALVSKEQRMSAAAAAPPLPVPEPEPEFHDVSGNLPPPRPRTEAEAWAEMSGFLTLGRGPTSGTG